MILLFSLPAIFVFGQGTTPALLQEPGKVEADLVEGNDSIKGSSKEKVNFNDLEHSPRRAMIYAIVLPGLGQAYNSKYWKIPIVYAALGGVGYWVYYNNQGYREISAIYSDDPSSNNQRYLKAWRRQLELSYIVTVGAYALQVLDAYVDANLFYWDVDPDLSLRIEPSIEPIYTTSGTLLPNYGFKCKLTF